MKFAIVIPARKGSKSLKNKNLKKINNIPLVEYTFKSIEKINFPKFILSDDLKIKKIANKYGIICEYNRPKSVSNDNTSLAETLIDFDFWLQNKSDFNIDAFVILQVTSPLRKLSDVMGAVDIFKKNHFSSLFSISESLEHPYESIHLSKSNNWNYNLPKAKKFYRRQDFDINSFFINGAIYIVRTNFFRKQKKIISKNHGIYIMKKLNSIDINDKQDFVIASKLLKK